MTIFQNKIFWSMCLAGASASSATFIYIYMYFYGMLGNVF